MNVHFHLWGKVASARPDPQDRLDGGGPSALATATTVLSLHRCVSWGPPLPLPIRKPGPGAGAGRSGHSQLHGLAGLRAPLPPALHPVAEGRAAAGKRESLQPPRGQLVRARCPAGCSRAPAASAVSLPRTNWTPEVGGHRGSRLVESCPQTRPPWAAESAASGSLGGEGALSTGPVGIRVPGAEGSPTIRALSMSLPPPRWVADGQAGSGRPGRRLSRPADRARPPQVRRQPV